MIELLAALAVAVGPTPPYLTPSLAWGDARHAWAGGAGGIVATSDAGASWRIVWRGEGSGLVAADTTHAWALSTNGVTIRTSDGVHWRPLGVQHLLRLSFADATRGFALERDDFVVRTRNGGASWTPTGGPQRLQSICFADARTGWVARAGTVWTTHDAGAYWQARKLMAARQGFPIPDLYCRGHDVWLVLHEGAAAGTEGYRIFRSLDGGATWRAVFGTFVPRLPQVSAYSGAIAALGGGAAVLEGSCAPCGPGTVTFVRTTNGGRTFARTTIPASASGPLAFTTRKLGLAIVTSTRRVPTIYRTRDGGRTWRAVFASRLLR
jgi:hypothetical protein